MLDINTLPETKLKEILTTFETPGYTFILEFLNEQIKASLSKMLSPGENDIKNLSYWRGLQDTYDTLLNLSHIIADKNHENELERETWHQPLGEFPMITTDLYGTQYIPRPPMPAHPSYLSREWGTTTFLFPTNITNMS